MKKMIVWICLFISMSAGAQTFFETHSDKNITYLFGIGANKTSFGLYEKRIYRNGWLDTIYLKLAKFDSMFRVLDSAVLPVICKTGDIGQMSIPAYLGKKDGKHLIFVTNTVQRPFSIGGGLDSLNSKRYVFEIDSNLNIVEKRRTPFEFRYFPFYSREQFFQDSSFFYSYSYGSNPASPNPLISNEMLLVKMDQNLDTLALSTYVDGSITLSPQTIGGKLWYTLHPKDKVDSLTRFPFHLDSTVRGNTKYVELCNRTILVDQQTMRIDTFLDFGWLHYGKQNAQTIGSRNYYRIPPPWSTFTSIQIAQQPTVHPVNYRGKVVVFGTFTELATNESNVAHVILDTNIQNFNIIRPLTVVKSPNLSSIMARVVPVAVATNNQKGIYVLCRKDSSNLNIWNSHYLLQFYDTNVNFVWQKVVTYQWFCNSNESTGFDMHFLDDGTLFAKLEMSSITTSIFHPDSVQIVFARFGPNGPNTPALPSQVIRVGTHILEPDVVVNIYPNPSSNGDLNLEGVELPYQLQITDITGKVMVQTGKTSQQHWDFGSLPSSLYVVTTTDRNGRVARMKWVKRE
jgi:hypothetical protein